MFYAFLAIFYVLFTALAWRRLNLAVLLTIVALPTYLVRFSVGPIPMTLLEGMILIVFAVWLIQRRIPNSETRIPKQTQISKVKNFVIRHSDFIIPMSLFVISATIGVFIAPDLRAAAGVWKSYFIEPILFFVVLADLMHGRGDTNNPSQIPNSQFLISNKIPKSKSQSIGNWKLEIGNLSAPQIVTALGLSILIPGLFAIYQKFTGSYIPNPFWAAEETRRVTSFYGYPNAIGLYFAPIVVLMLVYVITYLRKIVIARSREATKQSHTVMRSPPATLRLRLRFAWLSLTMTILPTTFYLLTAAIGLLSIVFAISKGALLAIFVSLFFLAIFWQGYRLVFTGLVVAALITGLLHPQLRTLTGTPTVEGGGSLEVRTQQWSEAWEMLKTRPILGAGLSGYQTRVTPFHKQEHIEIFMYPHNLVLNFWSETGLLGLIAFLWIVVLFFQAIFKRGLIANSQWLIVGPCAAMLALLAHGLVDVPYFKNDLSVLFWTIFALGLSPLKSANTKEIYVDPRHTEAFDLPF